MRKFTSSERQLSLPWLVLVAVTLFLTLVRFFVPLFHLLGYMLDCLPMSVKTGRPISQCFPEGFFAFDEAIRSRNAFSASLQSVPLYAFPLLLIGSAAVGAVYAIIPALILARLKSHRAWITCLCAYVVSGCIVGAPQYGVADGYRWKDTVVLGALVATHPSGIVVMAVASLAAFGMICFVQKPE